MERNWQAFLERWFYLIELRVLSTQRPKFVTQKAQWLFIILMAASSRAFMSCAYNNAECVCVVDRFLSTPQKQQQQQTWYLIYFKTKKTCIFFGQATMGYMMMFHLLTLKSSAAFLCVSIWPRIFIDFPCWPWIFSLSPKPSRTS